jgi:hypothetical protein
MQFTLFTSAVQLVAILATSVSAVPVIASSGQILDVWVPRIITPNASTIWTEGQQYNVTWDTSDAPANISNGAAVVFGENNTLTDKVLASGFDLRQGWINVTCPDDVTPGDNYTVILFGDSGDESKPFKIVAAKNALLGVLSAV